MNFLFPRNTESPKETNSLTNLLEEENPTSPSYYYDAKSSNSLSSATSPEEVARKEDRFSRSEELFKKLEHQIEEQAEEIQHLKEIWNSWVINPDDWKRLNEMFNKLDLTERGTLTKKRGIKIFSELDKSISGTDIEDIWNLSDLNRDGNLNANEFILAVFFLDKKLKGFPLPARHQISKKLVRSSTKPTSLAPPFSPSKKTIISPEAAGSPSQSRLKRSNIVHKYFPPKHSHFRQVFTRTGETRDFQLQMSIYQYSEHDIEYYEPHSVEEIPEIPASWVKVRWINFEGFNKNLLNALAKKFHLHELSIEDVQDVPQRPKVEYVSKNIVLTMQIFSLQNDSLEREQVSLFLIPHESSATILTIQEGKPGDCWQKLRETLTSRTIDRIADADFLIYSLLDSIIDGIEPITLHYFDKLDDIEFQLQSNPKQDFNVRNIFREILFIKRSVQPMILTLEKLLKPIENISNVLDNQLEEPYNFSSISKTYLRDSLDRLLRVNDNLDTIRDHCQSIQNQQTEASDHRMNKTIYLLTLVSTIFLPLTFLSRVYGMNFSYFPEVEWELGYFFFWGLAVTIILISVVLFKYNRLI